MFLQRIILQGCLKPRVCILLSVDINIISLNLNAHALTECTNKPETCSLNGEKMSRFPCFHFIKLFSFFWRRIEISFVPWNGRHLQKVSTQISLRDPRRLIWVDIFCYRSISCCCIRNIVLCQRSWSFLMNAAKPAISIDTDLISWFNRIRIKLYCAFLNVNCCQGRLSATFNNLDS